MNNAAVSLNKGGTLFGKRGTARSCAVCGQSGCTEWEGGAYSCRTHRGGQKGDVLNGYKFLKTDSVGLGLWIPDVDRSVDSYEPVARAVFVPDAGVDIERRDKQFRALSMSGGLSKADRAQLESKRGLSAEQIAQAHSEGLLFSLNWGDGQNVTHNALPGKWDMGRRKGWAGAKGMAIACRQYVAGENGAIKSRILGAQVATDLKDSKYLWMSDSSGFGTPARIPQFNSEKERGEQPITVHATGAKSDHIVVVEGILKPLIAMARHSLHGIDLGVGILGAASCHWGTTAMHQIKEQCSLLGASEIRLALDGGGPSNPDVWGGVVRFSRACLAAGLRFRIIWYSQFEKGGTDIDELTGPANYQLLTIAQVEGLERKMQAARALVDPAGAAVIQEKKDRKESAIASALPLAPTPGYHRDFGYLPNHSDELFRELLGHKLTIIRSGKGTGKSQLMKKLAGLVDVNSDNPAPIILFTHRLALGEALGELLGLPVKAERLEYYDGDGYVITVDSAHPKSGMRFDADSISANAIVVIDEADQVFSHIVSGQTAIKSARTDVIHHVMGACKTAANIVLLSADMKNREVDLMRRCLKLEQSDVLSIVNTHQRDLGTVKRYESAYEIIFKMQEVVSGGGRFIAKLSGQKDDSLTGTQTVEAFLKANNPAISVLRLDSQTLKDVSNPQTFIEVDKIVRHEETLDAQGNVVAAHYGPEIVEMQNDDGTTRRETRKTSQGILSYINHPDPAIREARQTKILGAYDVVLFTNACSTGISFEHGNFDDFFQIEQGVGSVDDMRQSLARYRPSCRRHVWIAEKGLAPARIGNGATSANRLQAGEDRKWARLYQQLCECGESSEELFSDVPGQYLSVYGAAWSDYATHRAAEFNAQSYAFAESFFAGIADEGYSVQLGFTPDWVAMSAFEQSEFRDAVKKARDINAAKNDAAKATVDVEGADLKTLQKKRTLTAKESNQLPKLKAMDRYGVEAHEVTPEIIEFDKNGGYNRLVARLYLEQGAAAVAKRDRAQLSKVLNRTQTWSTDLVRASHSHKVKMLEASGLGNLIKYLSAQNEDGTPRTVTTKHPLVKALTKYLIANRDEAKDVLGLTIGKEITQFNPDGSREQVIAINRPMALIQSLLKRLELNIKTCGQVTLNGDRVHKYKLIDVLVREHSDGTEKAVVDYAKFTAERIKSDRNLIDEEAANEAEKAQKRKNGQNDHTPSNTAENTCTLNAHRSNIRTLMCSKSPADTAQNSQQITTPNSLAEITAKVTQILTDYFHSDPGESALMFTIGSGSETEAARTALIDAYGSNYAEIIQPALDALMMVNA